MLVVVGRKGTERERERERERIIARVWVGENTMPNAGEKLRLIH